MGSFYSVLARLAAQVLLGLALFLWGVIALLDTERAILALGNEELAEIRDVLLENETELLEGIAELGKARKRLSQVAKVLDAVGGVLTTVAKVAKFAATGI